VSRLHTIWVDGGFLLGDDPHHGQAVGIKSNPEILLKHPLSQEFSIGAKAIAPAYPQIAKCDRPSF
jgi:hypothetical protein